MSMLEILQTDCRWFRDLMARRLFKQQMLMLLMLIITDVMAMVVYCNRKAATSTAIGCVG
jgi:hypothetical protein